MSNWQTFLIHQESPGSDPMLGIGGQSLATASFNITWLFSLFKEKRFFLSLDMDV